MTSAKTSTTPHTVRDAVHRLRPMVETFFARLEAGSRGEPGIMRDTYGPGENFGHAVLCEHAAAVGLPVSRDAAANTYVTMAGRDRDATVLIMGSHLDSVPHGGNFDGAAGVVAGLVTQAVLADLGIAPHCDVVVMGVRAEESVWFEVSYIGSRAALGTLPEGALDARRIDTGRSLSDHIAACGGDPDALRRGERHLHADRIAAFLEVHIEQAPSLFEAGHPVAVCTGIPGNVRYPAAQIVGRHDHVGTPRRFRHDAAMAGADLAMRLDALWAELDQAGTPLAVTFGRFHTDAALHGMTTVPGAFAFSLDVRAYDPAVLASVEARMMAMIEAIEAERQVSFVLGRRASAAVGVVDRMIADQMQDAASRLGIDATTLGSPASHDAAAFAAAGVPVAMIFVRNENGSHNPDEKMEIDDFLDACAVLAQWVVERVA